MRYSWSIPVLLVLVALAGYAAGGRPLQAQAQAQTIPIRRGEIVLFSFQDGDSRECLIEEVRGEFARCGDPADRSGSAIGRPARREPPEQWVNVSVVEWVTKAREQR